MSASAPTPNESVEALFNRAFALHQANKPEAAQLLYEQVLSRNPKHAHAVHSLGVIASSDGRRADALQLFRQAISLKGDDAIFYHNLGRTLQADGQSTEALENLRRAVEINPDFLGAWQALAELYYAVDDTNETARAIQKVADLQTKTAEAWNQKGLALVNANRLNEAAAAFRAGLACNPRGAGLYFNAGNVLMALGHHADAISCLTQAATLEPKVARVYVSLSNVHYRKGDLDAALRARSHALQIDASLPEANFEVGSSPILANAKRPAVVGGVPTRTVTLTFAKAIEQAIERHNAGDHASAELLYRKVLHTDPVNADALHLLGVLLHQRGEHRAGLELIDRVLVRGNASANVYANRAAILISLGEFQMAEASAQRALEIDPSHRGAQDNFTLVHSGIRNKCPEGVLVNLRPELPVAQIEMSASALESVCCLSAAATAAVGDAELTTARTKRDSHVAVRDMQRSVEDRLDVLEGHIRSVLMRPTDCVGYEAIASVFDRIDHQAAADLARGLANALRQTAKGPGDNSDKLKISMVSRCATFLQMVGLILTDAGRYASACACYEASLNAVPNAVSALSNWAGTLLRAKLYEEALGVACRAVNCEPTYVPAVTNLGKALFNLDRVDEAITHFKCALSLGAGGMVAITAWEDLGVALLRMGRVKEAISAFRELVALDQSRACSHFNLSIALLKNGEYLEGWREFEWRVAVAPMEYIAKFSTPPWKGEELHGKSLLLHTEHGFGDSIQFIRYAALCQERGATVIVHADAEIKDLLASAPGVAEVYAKHELIPTTDYQIPLLSLPHQFQTEIETVPKAVPYLAADLRRREMWSKRLADCPRPLVGLAWAGSKQHGEFDRRRSVDLKTLAPLRSIDATYVSLQKDAFPSTEQNGLEGVSIIYPGEDWRDFTDGAAIIDNLDLVISVDTSIAHLAGALGKQVWMLCRFDGDWRWLADRTDSPWYPSMRIFRQLRHGDWVSVVDQVVVELSSMFDEHWPLRSGRAVILDMPGSDPQER